MSVQYASFSVGKSRSTKSARGRRELFDQASEMLNAFSLEEIRSAHRAGTPLNVRFVDNQAVLFRGEHPEGSKWAGVPPKEIAAARAKVAAVRDAASRPMVDARARIAHAKALANQAWEAT